MLLPFRLDIGGHPRRLNTLRAMYTTGECGREGMHEARDARARDRQNCLHDNGGVSDIITPWLLNSVCGRQLPRGTARLCGARHSRCVEPWSKTDL